MARRTQPGHTKRRSRTSTPNHSSHTRPQTPRYQFGRSLEGGCHSAHEHAEPSKHGPNPISIPTSAPRPDTTPTPRMPKRMGPQLASKRPGCHESAEPDTGHAHEPRRREPPRPEPEAHNLRGRSEPSNRSQAHYRTTTHKGNPTPSTHHGPLGHPYRGTPSPYPPMPRMPRNPAQGGCQIGPSSQIGPKHSKIPKTAKRNRPRTRGAPRRTTQDLTTARVKQTRRRGDTNTSSTRNTNSQSTRTHDEPKRGEGARPQGQVDAQRNTNALDTIERGPTDSTRHDREQEFRQSPRDRNGGREGWRGSARRLQPQAHDARRPDVRQPRNTAMTSAARDQSTRNYCRTAG